MTDKRGVGFSAADDAIGARSGSQASFETEDERRLRRRSMGGGKKLKDSVKAKTISPGDIEALRASKQQGMVAGAALPPPISVDDSLTNSTSSASSNREAKTPSPLLSPHGQPSEMSIVVDNKGYWLEGYSGDPPPDDSSHSFAYFRLQDFKDFFHYEKYFFGTEHVNFMSETPEVGPVLISITREPSYPNGVRPASKPKISGLKKFMSLRGAKDLLFHGDKDDKEKDKEAQDAAADSTAPAGGPTPAANAPASGADAATTSSDAIGAEAAGGDDGTGFYRALIRTKVGDFPVKISTTNIKKDRPGKHALLEALVAEAPEVPFDWETTDFKETNATPEDIRDMEQKLKMKGYKFGVIYAKQGQTTDDEMLNNRENSSVFEAFLKLIGDKIELKGWAGYNGGLDVKHESTGSHSVHSVFKDYEIMFHVATMLPHKEGDEQQLEKKRHIGNDIVVLVFQEGDTPFDPTKIKSEFNHVFIVVRPIKPGTKVDGPLPQPLGSKLPIPLPIRQLRLAGADAVSVLSPRASPTKSDKASGDMIRRTTTFAKIGGVSFQEKPLTSSIPPGGLGRIVRATTTTLEKEPAHPAPPAAPPSADKKSSSAEQFSDESDEGEPTAKKVGGTRTKKLRRTKSQGIDKNTSAVIQAHLKTKDKQVAGAAPPEAISGDRPSSKDKIDKRKSSGQNKIRQMDKRDSGPLALPPPLSGEIPVSTMEKVPSDNALQPSPSADSVGSRGSREGLSTSRSKESIPKLDKQQSEKAIPRQSSKDKALLDRQVSERALPRSGNSIPKLDLDVIDEAKFGMKNPLLDGASPQPGAPPAASPADPNGGKLVIKKASKATDGKSPRHSRDPSIGRDKRKSGAGDAIGDSPPNSAPTSPSSLDKARKKKDRASNEIKITTSGDLTEEATADGLFPSESATRLSKPRGSVKLTPIGEDSFGDDFLHAQSVPVLRVNGGVSLPPPLSSSGGSATPAVATPSSSSSEKDTLDPKKKRRLSDSPREPQAPGDGPSPRKTSPRGTSSTTNTSPGRKHLPPSQEMTISAGDPASVTTAILPPPLGSDSATAPAAPAPAAPHTPSVAERRLSLSKARLSGFFNIKAKSFVKYRVEIVSKDGVVACEPELPNPPIFSHGPYFKEFLLSKMINYERAAFFSDAFSKPIEKARGIFLTNLYNTK